MTPMVRFPRSGMRPPSKEKQLRASRLHGPAPSSRPATIPFLPGKSMKPHSSIVPAAGNAWTESRNAFAASVLGRRRAARYGPASPQELRLFLPQPSPIRRSGGLRERLTSISILDCFAPQSRAASLSDPRMSGTHTTDARPGAHVAKCSIRGKSRRLSKRTGSDKRMKFVHQYCRPRTPCIPSVIDR
jgi:hypothetical protein